MAVSTSFKVKCPSCEAMVTIRDEGSIGKKTECTKCKYKFIVERPEEDEDDKPAKGKSAPDAKKKKLRDDDVDNPKGKKTPPGKKTRDDDDDEEEGSAKGKKGSSKLVLGLVLAGVGVVVLSVAAYFMMFSGNRPAPGGGGVAQKPGGANPDDAAPKTPEKKADEAKPPVDPAVAASEAEFVKLSNLLPGNTESVFHLHARDAFNVSPALRESIFGVPGSLEDSVLRKRLGFAIDQVDDLIRAECYTSSPWTYTVLHFRDAVNEEELKKALNLKPATPIEGLAYYQSTESNPWFDQLARFTFGVPTSLGQLLNRKADRPMFIRLHDAQTLLIADETPMLAFLKAKGNFPTQSQPVRPAPANPGANPGMPPGFGMMGGSGMPPFPGGGASGMPPGFGMTGGSSAPSIPPLPGGGRPDPNGLNLPPGRLPLSRNEPQVAGGESTGGGASLDNTRWDGTENLSGFNKLSFELNAGGQAVMVDARERVNGTWRLQGNKLTVNLPGYAIYNGTVNGRTMSGTGVADGKTWTFAVNQAGGGANPGAGGQPPIPGGQPPIPGGQPPIPGGQPPIPGGQPPLPGGQPTFPGQPSVGQLPTPGQPSAGQIPTLPGQSPDPTPGTTPPNPAEQLRSETYMTIKPSLKAMLDKMEARPENSKDKILFSAAVDLDAARINTSNPEFKDLVVRQPRQFWDVTLMLTERKPRMRLLGMALIQKEKSHLHYRNQITCAQEQDAKEFHKEILDVAGPKMVRFFDRLLNHKVELVKAEAAPEQPANPGGGFPNPGGGFPMPGGMRGGSFNPPTPGGSSGAPGQSSGGPTIPGMPPVGASSGGPPTIPGGFPMPPGGGLFPGQPGGQPAAPPVEAKEITASQIATERTGATLDFTLDLILRGQDETRLSSIVTLVSCGLRSEMDMAAGLFSRHDLAKAGKTLGEKGLADVRHDTLSAAGLQAGQFPPGAFPRASTLRSAREPSNRVSWMVGLLPYLGHDTLFNQVDFSKSWRDPVNWIPGRTIVPQFLDPRFPDHARRFTDPGVPVEFGATHYVGLAGVGLDAASCVPGDPATLHKRGVFAYDRSASLDEIGKGRGLSNTILMIEAPHDGVVGASPWIAGGGATIRGVPEKNSIAPFVLGADRAGKTIQHQGKRGTFAVMTDGTVRFIDQNVSDEVFKAMATISGPAPANFDLDSNDSTPKIADKAKPAAKAPETKPAPKTEVPAVNPEAPKVETPKTADPKVDAPKALAPPAAAPEKTSRSFEPAMQVAVLSEMVAGSLLRRTA